MRRFNIFKRLFALLLVLLFAAAVPMPRARAERVVRVGYFYARNFQEGMSNTAVKRGYAYDYLQALTAYNDWDYEYVYGEESALYDMLVAGDIDLLAGLASTSMRTGKVRFPDRPMGRETYTLYTLLGSGVTLRDGIRIGTIANTARADQLQKWAAVQDFSVDIREFKDSAGMSAALISGWLDAIVEADNNIDSETVMVPLAYIGSADYYLCCTASNSELLHELNSAQIRLGSERIGYTDSLQNRYFGKSAIHAILSSEERQYIEKYPTLRIGYIDNFLPFCSVSSDFRCCGLLPDIVDDILDKLNIQNDINLVYIPFDSFADMRRAIIGGTLDILFPMPSSVWHSENMRVAVTDPIFDVSMELVYLSYDESTTSVIAVNEQDPLTRIYVETFYPDARIVSCTDADAALQAVLNKTVGCTVLNGLISRAYLSKRAYISLSSTELEDDCNVCMAVRRKASILRTLLNRGISQLDASHLQSEMIAVSESMHEYTLWDFVTTHLVLVLCVISGIGFIILALFIAHILSLRRNNNQLMIANAAREAAEHETLRMLHSIEIDESTGVYTRQAFYAHSAEFISANADPGCDLWISDVENFKLINSMYGGISGDRLLRFIAARLNAAFPEALIGHFNADHFAVLMRHDDSTGTDAARRLAAVLSADSPIPRVVMKFGIYRNIDPDLHIALACDRAMVALQSLRNSYENTVAEFDDPQIASIQRVGRMESDFADAIAYGEFSVWYQPKYSLRTARIIGAEALVRWQRKDGTMISPAEFIPVFENDGLIRRLDEYVFRRVCKDIREWIDLGHTAVPVSVNMSRTTLHTENLAQNYADIVRASNLPFDLLAIELTESAAVGDARVRPLAESLTAAGFSLHMDDFGSGYSSLASINALPFDVVKLDKSLIDDIGEQGGNEVVRHVIEMCHFKSMPVVAEGVEKQYQIDFLTRLGCDMIQGYYFSPPIPGDDFGRMLTANVRLETESDTAEGVDKVSQDSIVRYLVALGNIYACIYVFDPVNDTVMEYSSMVYLHEHIHHRSNAAEQLRSAIEHIISPEHLDQALEFTDLSTVCARMVGRRNIVADFIGLRFGWTRFQFIAVSFDDDGMPIELIFTMRIVEKEKRRESELLEAIRLDELTGVNNRHAFTEDIQSKLNDYPDGVLPSSLTVVSLDVNDLKVVNDTYGHAAGDELLRGAADCMTRAWGSVGSVYRLGGDEFLVITTSDAVPSAMANFNRYVKHWYGNQVASMRVAVGVASASEITSNQINDLINLADRRMYENKRAMKS